MQSPLWQVSTPSQNNPSSVQGVPFVTVAFAGQVLLLPSQLSARSHSPAAARQTAVLLASAGQLMLDPVQCSARSQSPAAARQTVVGGASTSGGQLVPVPVQCSGASHTWPNDEARQTV